MSVGRRMVEREFIIIISIIKLSIHWAICASRDWYIDNEGPMGEWNI